MQETERSNFDMLKTGILSLMMRLEMEKSHLRAIGHLSERAVQWFRISEYVHDMERVKKELGLAISFAKNNPDDAFLKFHAVNFEDYLMYHQGYFLELVHQFKDKLFRVIDAMTTKTRYGEKEESRDLKINDLIEKVETCAIQGLSDLLRIWDQESGSGISVALKRRTKHHHYRNRLILDENFLNARLYGTLQRKQVQELFNEQGRQLIVERRKKSLKRWHLRLVQKMEDTKRLIDENLESISKVLVEHFKLPVDDKEVANICQKYIALGRSSSDLHPKTEHKI